jgi:hypothetical protein
VTPLLVVLAVATAPAALAAGVTVGVALHPRPPAAARYVAACLTCLVFGLVIAGAVLAQ